MPLEIRELVIKAAVSSSDSSNHEESSVSQGAFSHDMTRQDRESIINACVEKILAILKEKSER